MHFSKMHGLGNDFMVIDAVTQNIRLSSDHIRQLADRRHGVGFDQLLLIEPPHDPDIDFHYRIFNADASEVFQCGNGARCLARFVRMKGLAHRAQLDISTKVGKLTLYVDNEENISVNMSEPNFEPKSLPFHANKAESLYLLRFAERTLMFGAVSMGNPHCVIQVENAHTAEVEKIGSWLVKHERFPEGVNVGFMEIIKPNHIRLRVYERGAGETLACGSGACAAVAIGIQQGLLLEQVRVDLPGGTLHITWKGAGSPLWMQGPATHVYDGYLHL